MKTIEEIYDEMLAVFRTETGAEASAVSDLSVKLYAVAAQVYGLYSQAEWLSKQCFPQTAEGEWLDRHAGLRGLTRREAVKAEGRIRFSVDSAANTDLTIPVGTVCATAGQVRFETTEEGVLTAGETAVEVNAAAMEVGTAGNVPAGSVLAMAVPPVGVSRCVNVKAFTGGTDTEEDENLRARVLETYRRMPNGANAAFYEQAALSFEQVAAVAVLPRSRGVGTVDVVIATQSGVPDAGLLEKVGDYIQKRREIAVDVEVKAPVTKAVDTSITVKVNNLTDAERVKTEVEGVLRAYFSGEGLGKDVLRAKLNQLVFSVEGVANCDITTPDADVAVAAGELPVLGTLTVEVTV